MSDPVTIGTFAISSASSIYAHSQQKRQIRAANKAKLANWENTKREYYNQITLDNAAWKDSVQNSNIAIDNLFDAQAKEWESQDLHLEEIVNNHSANKINIIKKMYEAEYAGEQTGVTAQRKARSSIRDAGYALTESVRKVVLAEKKIDLSKETGAMNTEAKRRAQWMQTRQPPVPGAAPPPPVLQNLPGKQGLALQIAMSAATATVGGLQTKALKDSAKAAQETAKALKEASILTRQTENIVNTSSNLKQLGSASTITDITLGQRIGIGPGDLGIGAADPWLLRLVNPQNTFSNMGETV